MTMKSMDAAIRTKTSSIVDSFSFCTRSRNFKDRHLARSLDLLKECNSYIKAFKLRYKPVTLPDADKLLEAAKRATKAAKVKAAKDKRKAERESKDKIADWREGFFVSLPYNLDIMLRVQGDQVQTSQGATFPISHALKAYKLIKACHDQSREFKKNGRSIKLGYFEIDKIETNGNVKAGCHYIKYDEIDQMGKHLLILEEKQDD